MTTENITLSNGVTVDIDILRHPGASAIVPLSEKNTVILIRQYRHAVVEETGFSAREFQKLGEITPVPGYSDERIHIFLATGLEPAEQNLDMDELLNVHEIEFDKTIEMIRNGDIQDCKTISGLYMARDLLKTERL
ncbi:MAG: NUDIX hydrolase [Desulfobacteraceae bacterium]|nr:NUDIX hydrolase [Desulfobacteraceae bacterium]